MLFLRHVFWSNTRNKIAQTCNKIWFQRMLIEMLANVIANIATPVLTFSINMHRNQFFCMFLKFRCSYYFALRFVHICNFCSEFRFGFLLSIEVNECTAMNALMYKCCYLHIRNLTSRLHLSRGSFAPSTTGFSNLLNLRVISK